MFYFENSDINQSFDPEINYSHKKVVAKLPKVHIFKKKKRSHFIDENQ